MGRAFRSLLALAVLALALLRLAGSAVAQAPDDRAAVARDRRIAGLAASWRDEEITVGEVAATTSMALAIALVAFSAGGWGQPRRTEPRDRAASAWLIAGAAVLAWSVAVRFGLTQANILTDGGSGYTRLMRYVEGYGGIAVLVQLLPGEWSAFMWHAMLVPRMLAALAPALLVWVARELNLGLGAALLAGVMLASLPVDAVLTSSDHLEGAMATLQLAGLAFVLAARRAERVDLYAAGLALAAWAMWCRPEGALGLLPIAPAALGFSRRWWTRPSVWVANAALIALVLARVYALATSSTTGLGGSGLAAMHDAWQTVASVAPVVPVWVWLPAPFALLWLHRRAAMIVLAALAAGVVPVYLRGLSGDPVGTHLETIRYGIPALGSLALMSAVTLEACLGALVKRVGWNDRWVRVALLTGIAALPIVDREYLARRYGHVASEAVIRRLFQQVPAGCAVAVPDDGPEGVDVEIAQRYGYIALEMAADGAIAPLTVLPASDLLDGRVDATACWTFLRGPYCYHGFDGHPAISCQRIEERFALQEIATELVEFRHHRLVTGPDLQRSPWYMPGMPITLYRITGSRLAAPSAPAG